MPFAGQRNQADVKDPREPESKNYRRRGRSLGGNTISGEVLTHSNSATLAGSLENTQPYYAFGCFGPLGELR
jgi:hypothetical protein